jgi:hypothetical protein
MGFLERGINQKNRNDRRKLDSRSRWRDHGPHSSSGPSPGAGSE